MTDKTAATSAPLSFVAEQMVAGIVRRLKAGCGETLGLHDAVLDLLDHHRAVVEKAAGKEDLAEIEAAAQRQVDAGNAGQPIDRDWLIARAASAAGAAGRSVIAPVDLAAPLLRAAGPALMDQEEAVVGPRAELEEEPEEPAALPFGFLAEQLLASLDREVGRADGGGRGPSSWLLALSRGHPDLAAEATEGTMSDLEAEARRRVEADASELPLGREQIVTAASEQARDAGRSVVTPADVTRAIVELAQREPEPPPAEPHAEPSKPVPEPTETPVTPPEAELESEPVPPEPDQQPEPVEPAEPRVTTERPPRTPQERVIRVFVSSTFRDMQDEREELVKRVFPQLRKLCEERGVTWGEVDLRWGITEEQAERGEVLPICLEEIRRCRPYFIGILGQRYGWVPDEYPPDLLEEQRWLQEHLEHSITELEILHGVLKDPEMADHAYFYLRDPAYVASLPPDVQPDYREGPTDEEIEEYGPQEAQRRAEDRREKLEALKAQLRESDFPVREDYANPVELGELVLQDLTALIDRLYPEGEQPDPLDREATDHQAFAASRAGVYIGRPAYIDRLDAHAQGVGDPLVVLGESGSGKSALLANWALDYRAEQPDELVLMHFIGASPYSADWRAMLRRVMGELKRHFDLQEEIPDEPDALRAAFANWLHMAAARGRVILILDALNQLEDREGAPDLVWLPPEMPENVRLVVSTLPGRPLDALEERGWPTLTVKPLRPDEREELIEKYLGQYGKTLEAERREEITAAPQAANPLYLRALLEELRVFGDFDTLGPHILHYLDATTVPDLYAKILERYEEDYERERPDLVEEAMSLLWASRRGLSEAELLELLGSDGEPLPQAHWAPLYLAAERSLVSRAGLIGFSHDYLRQAVRERYLSTEEERKEAHERLAGYFAARDLGPRQIDELPWQLEQAESWQRLYELLADLDFFQAAWEANQFEVKARWAQVEANSDLRMVDAYRPLIDAPGDYDEASRRAAMMLLSHTGHESEALVIGRGLIEHYRRCQEQRKLALMLGEVGQLLEEPAKMMAAFREQEEIARALGHALLEAHALIGQAGLMIDLDQLDDAQDCLRRQAALARQSGDPTQIHLGLGNRAVIHAKRADFDAAEDLLREKEQMARQIGDLAGVASALTNRGTARVDRGDPASAIPLLEEAARIQRVLGDRRMLWLALMSWAKALLSAESPDEAERPLREALKIAEGLGAEEAYREALDLLCASLSSQGAQFGRSGAYEDAIRVLTEAVKVGRQLADGKRLARALAGLSVALDRAGRGGEAQATARDALRVASTLDSSRLRRGIEKAVGGLAAAEIDASQEIDEAAREWVRDLRREEPEPADELSRLRATRDKLRRAVERDPGDTVKLTELGRVCLKLGELDEAESVLQSVLDADGAFTTFERVDSKVRELARRGRSFHLPTSTREVMSHLAFVYEGLGKPNLAESCMLDAVYDCEEPDLLVMAGRFYLESTAPEVNTAIVYFSKAVSFSKAVIPECDELLDAFIASHKHLYPRASWQMIEGYLDTWEAVKEDRE